MKSYSIHVAALGCSLLAVLLYLNTLEADLVFDDTAAILTNRDLLPSSPWSNLLFHDFWGDDIRHVKSHKSFRPITSASFKLNYHLHGDKPMHYHSVNVILNAVVSYLFVLLSHRVLGMELGLAVLSGILYTIHPLHTEAVAGVVGRAELLAAIFFLLTLFTYQRAASSKHVGWPWLLLSMLLGLCSMVSKEQGITVVAACICFEAFIILKLSWQDGVYLIRTALFKSHKLSARHGHFLARAAVMLAFLMIVFLGRFSLMGGSPTFSKSDNPGQRLATPLRQVYYLHLIFANVWIFLCPSKLRHDWRFGPVPLFNSLSDTRNLWTIITFISLGTLGLSCVMRKGKYAKITAFSFSLAVATFLPSSNLFFLVGFVVAERVLYLPTMGACLLMATGIWKILSHGGIAKVYKTSVKFATLCLIVMHSVKTVHRNQVWHSGFNLYVDALKLYPADGLMFSNLGYEFRQQNNSPLAEECHVMAVKMAPNYSQPFRNYGSFLNAQGRYDEAEKMLREAIRVLGFVQRSKRSRRAPTYHNLANILSRNESRLDEAISLLLTIIKLEPDESTSYAMLGNLLMKQNKTREGKSTFDKAFKLFPQKLGLRYDAAQACLMVQDRECAERLYAQIIELDKKQGMALLNYSTIIAEKVNATPEELVKAHKYLQAIIKANSSFVEAFYALALVDVRLNRRKKAQENLHRTLSMKPGHSGAIKSLAKIYYNEKNYSKTAEVLSFLSEQELGLRENSFYLNILGSSYSALGLYSRAVSLYKTVVEQDSQHAEAYLALGKIYAMSKNYKEAEKFLETAQQLNETNSETQLLLDKLKVLKRH